MTQLSTICNLASNLPRSQRAAIISLIDLKTEGDMQKVLDRLDLMEQKLDAKFDAKFDALNNKISMTQWFVVIVLTLLTVIVAIPKLG